MRHTYANTRGKERERVIERGWNRQSALHKKQQEKTTTVKAIGEDQQYHHTPNFPTYQCTISVGVGRLPLQNLFPGTQDKKSYCIYAMVTNRALGMYI